MSKNKTWAPPGWPWELDILALIFLVIALAVPYAIFSGQTADPSLSINPAEQKLKEQTYMLWSIGICLLYVMHLALAGARLETLSTPFIHLLSPMVFALLAYFRIYTVATDMEQSTMVTGEPAQIALLIAGVFVLTFVVARLRMARYLHRFRDVQWDLLCASRYDASYLELITQFRPLVYPPRRYRVCENGILVEGWFYTIAIPFEMVQTINPVRTMGIAAAGNYYASNTGALVRFELLDSGKPIFISPDNRDEFIQYCARHVARMRPSANHQSRHGGTSPGTSARHTHAGSATVRPD